VEERCHFKKKGKPMSNCAECKKYFVCHIKLKKGEDCNLFVKKDEPFFFTKLHGKETEKDNV
jgi:hypothetical protein